MPFPLRSNQYDVVDRLINYCHDKHGLLIYHTMGSGKSMIGISYMANFYRVNKLIIVPKGVEVPWKKDITDSKLDVNMGVCSSAKNNECKTSFLTYDELTTISESDFYALTQNAIVCCDEAHLLIDLLKYSPNASTIRNCLRKAKKLLLFTGTPIQTGLGDLGILINLCAKKREMPAITALYSEPPYSNKAFTLTNTFGNTINMITGSLLATAGIVTGITSVTVGLPVLFVVGLLSSNSVMAIMNNLINDVKLVSEQYVAEKSKGYVSFFDYKFKNNTDNSLIDFPLIFSGRPLRHYFELTEFQTHVKYLQQNRQLNTNETYFQIFGDLDFDKEKIILDDKTIESYTEDYTGATLKETKELYLSWIKRGRVLGNLSINHLFFETQTSLPNKKMRDNDPKKISSYSRSYQRVKKEKFYSEDEKERCYSNLPNLAETMGLPYNTEADRQQVFDELSKISYDCPKYHAALTEIMQSRQESNYLPVVYTNFDEQGLQTFSAFLTDRGYPHIVIHPDDDPDVRKKLVEIANLPHRKLQFRFTEGKYMPVQAGSAYNKHEYGDIVANRFALRKTVVVEGTKDETQWGFYKKLVIPGKTEIGKKYLAMDEDETGNRLFAFLNEDVIKQTGLENAVDLSIYTNFMTDEENFAIMIINKLNVTKMKYALDDKGKKILMDNDLLCSILACITKLKSRLQVVIDFDLLSLMRKITENVKTIEDKMKRPEADRKKLRDELLKLNSAVNMKIKIITDFKKKLKREESKIRRLQDNIIKNMMESELENYPEFKDHVPYQNDTNHFKNLKNLYGITLEEEYNKLRAEAIFRGDKTQILYDRVKKKLDAKYGFHHYGFTNGIVDETYEVPVCVLLHPSIREGIGFDCSPKLIALEVPYGMGTREQIYARVLRSVNAEKRKLCFIDGTFAKNSDLALTRKPAKSYSDYFSWFSKAPQSAEIEYPWRVNKEIVQLMNGNVTTTIVLPEILQKLTGQLTWESPINPEIIIESTKQQYQEVISLANDKLSELNDAIRSLEYTKSAIEINIGNERTLALRMGYINKSVSLAIGGIKEVGIKSVKMTETILKSSYGTIVQAFNGLGQMKKEYNKAKNGGTFQGTFIDYYFKLKSQKGEVNNSIADESVYYLNKGLELFTDQFGRELMKMNDLDIARSCGIPAETEKCGIVNYDNDGPRMYKPGSFESLPIDNPDSCLYKNSGISNYEEFKSDYTSANSNYKNTVEEQLELQNIIRKQITEEQEADEFFDSQQEVQAQVQRQRQRQPQVIQNRRKTFLRNISGSPEPDQVQTVRSRIQNSPSPAPDIQLGRSKRQPQVIQNRRRTFLRNLSGSQEPPQFQTVRSPSAAPVGRRNKRQDRQDSAYGSQQPQER